MNELAKQYTTSVLTRAAGCSPVTFRAWRNRNGLFPETKDDQKWNRFSIIDICIVRAIVVITEFGVGAKEAIWSAEEFLRSAIKVAYIPGPGMSAILGISRTKATEEVGFYPYLDVVDIRNILDESGGLLLLIDLQSIIAHVKANLPGGA
ncbi:hypothetical protein FV232_26280 [Methylobacterium sp. WL30]|uniref:hypothetical protein n=1 Tax=unclassified Methylobacterium TaxID=2615210 RepID=UPI0011CBF3A2|nr:MULTISPECIES: hypothetical protein [unclassified Methylobacterium]TXN26162.1 hypothetical protein FV225_23760 [Methylobacterium sp. WL93]TXN52151.1 hypothetical protein FV227_05135 [Methylobacterium sp. WL119]TXN62012.1 hypothetical protein FV232_26280 [Methylobacterium sp. WL30]